MAKQSKSQVAGKSAFAQLQDHLSIAEGNRDVEWEYRLGKLVDELCPRSTRGYGHGAIQTLADELGIARTSANKLWNARKLSSSITPQELGKLLKTAKTAGHALTASHVLSLATIRDEATRVELGLRCAQHGWGVRQLRWEIHRSQGKLSQGGAPVAKLATPDDALFDLLDRSKNWLSRFEQVWFHRETGMLHTLSKKETKRLAALLDETLDVLAELRSAADEGRRQIRAMRSGTA